VLKITTYRLLQIGIDVPVGMKRNPTVEVIRYV